LILKISLPAAAVSGPAKAGNRGAAACQAMRPRAGSHAGGLRFATLPDAHARGLVWLMRTGLS
jgi:hypothetical protein